MCVRACVFVCVREEEVCVCACVFVCVCASRRGVCVCVCGVYEDVWCVCACAGVWFVCVVCVQMNRNQHHLVCD